VTNADDIYAIPPFQAGALWHDEPPCTGRPDMELVTAACLMIQWGERSQQGSFEKEVDLKDQASWPGARIYLRSLAPMVRGNAIRQIKPTQIQSFAIEVENNIISQNCF
jgi:hypothetical protein